MTKPFFMPTPYFAIPLGLSATAIAWFHLGNILPFGEKVGNVLGIISVSIWLLFSSLYLYKLFAYREQVKEEWQCPVRFSFLALIPITTMLAGAILYHWHIKLLGEVLIWFGVIGQLLYAGLRIGSLWKGDIFKEESVQPPFYLPAIAANFTIASTLALLGYTDLASLFLGAGLIAWIIFEPILLQRLRVLPLPAPVRPTMGIILAPAFVGSSAYLAINGGEVDLLVKLLWGYGFLQLIFLLRVLPWIAQNGFVIGFWAFSFGLASMANGAVSVYQNSQLGFLAITAFTFANIIISLLMLNTVVKVIQGKFWLK